MSPCFKFSKIILIPFSPQFGNEKPELLFWVSMLFDTDVFDADSDLFGVVSPLMLGVPTLTLHCPLPGISSLLGRPPPLPQAAIVSPSNVQISQSLPRSL